MLCITPNTCLARALPPCSTWKHDPGFLEARGMPHALPPEQRMMLAMQVEGMDARQQQAWGTGR